MKAYSSREIIKILVADGWYEVRCVGDHHQYKHPTKKDFPIRTVKSIFKQAGINTH